MIGQADITVLALWHPSARAALYHRSKSPAILKQNHLLFIIECLADILQQQRRELPRHPLLAVQLLYIYRNNLRQLNFLIAFFQFHPPEFAGSGILPSLHRRSGSTQQRLCPIHRSQHDGSIPGMIARCGILLLIRIFVFLVHNDQSEIPKREEHRRAYPQNNIVTLLRQLLLPDLYSLGVGELGVIDSQPGAEHPFQPFGDLGSQCYFGQQIKHLPALPQRLFYQVDVYFGLSTGSHSVEQTDILLLKALHDFMISPLLVLVQHVQFYRLSDQTVQPPDFLIIDLEYLFFYQSVENSGRSRGTLQKFFLGHFFGCTVPQHAGKLHILHQQRQLFRSALQLVKDTPEILFTGSVCRQPDPGFRFGFIGAAELFFYKQSFLVEQRLDNGENVFQSALFLKFGDTLLGFFSKQVEHQLLAFRKRSIRLEVGIILHNRLALQLQAGRQCGFVNITLRTQIIIGQPFPEPELTGQQYRRGVKYGRNLFDFIFGRCIVMHIANNGCIVLLSPERYNYPATYLHLFSPFVRKGIGKATGQRQR